MENLEHLYINARIYGLSLEATRELHAPLTLRADAWCYRVDLLLGQRHWWQQVDAALSRPLARQVAA